MSVNPKKCVTTLFQKQEIAFVFSMSCGQGASKKRKHALIPQNLDIGTAIEELLLIWLASEASEWADRLEWLPL